jgi:hypothetical protein
MYALKKIQRYWKKKYLQVKERSAVKIQNIGRKFIKKMDNYRLKLGKIRSKVLQFKLKRALLLYAKNRRSKKAYIR